MKILISTDTSCLIDTFLSEFSASDFDYTFATFDLDKKAVDIILNYANLKLGVGNYVSGNVPINICAHCGLGTIGLLVTEKINGMTLKDFN